MCNTYVLRKFMSGKFFSRMIILDVPNVHLWKQEVSFRAKRSYYTVQHIFLGRKNVLDGIFMNNFENKTDIYNFIRLSL